MILLGRQYALYKTVRFYSAFNFLLITSLIYAGVRTVSITELRVPATVRNGTSSGVLLDCLYSLRPEEQGANGGLVVKWFLNRNATPVYQWIHNTKPQSSGPLKDRLKLDYVASDNNATAHRALFITNPTIELSGDYKCLVSTNTDEDFMIKKMIVYATEKKFELSHSRQDIERVNVTCRVTGVYPEPTLTLYNESGRLDNVAVTHTYKENNVFDVVTSILIHDSELSSPTTFDCELSIPSTQYTRRKTLHYYPGSTESLSSVSDSGTHLRCKRWISQIIYLILPLLYIVHV